MLFGVMVAQWTLNPYVKVRIFEERQIARWTGDGSSSGSYPERRGFDSHPRNNLKIFIWEKKKLKY